jgi:hypothetical protein
VAGKIVQAIALSHSLKPFQMEMRDEKGTPFLFVQEISPFTPLHYTKFRTLFPLKIEFLSTSGGWYLYRPPTFFRSRFFVKEKDGSVSFQFQPKGFLSTTYRIYDRSGISIGEGKFSNPFLVGSQKGVVLDRSGRTVVALEWDFSFWGGYKRGVSVFHEEGDPWWKVGLSFLVLRGILLQQR